MNNVESIKNFSVTGKVQGVYFRKSFLFVCHKRNLSGAVTNDPKDSSLVNCSLKGDSEAIQKLLYDLEKVSPLNSLGAEIDSILKEPHKMNWDDHDYKYTYGLDSVIKPPLLIKVNL